ncbi:MAG: prepilin-type N-terminal cleavage/methylation domain-containing protein [Lysobacterales bacterium]|nr:MAG: prepilin-type N-terminal cleavage/methylation domain-containing protein [Xanthomonadales bacterium]
MMPRGKVPGGRLRGRGGFTLVELLLALGLMSMLLAMAYGGLRAATRAADRGQTILQDSGRIRMAHQFVRKQLNQMMPLVFAESEDRTERSVFLGSADRIRFVAPMPGYLGFGGPQVQELAIVQGDDGLELVLSHALLQGFEEQLLYESLPIPLLDKIERAEFSFLARDENGELMGWTTSWTEIGTLPESVALEVEFVEDVYIKWPLLTASVRVDETALSELAGAQSADPAYGTTIRDMINRRQNRQ